MLAYGSHEERVVLEALPLEQRTNVLRAFPTKVPAGVQFFRYMYELPKADNDLPEAFAALAPQCVVFRITE